MSAVKWTVRSSLAALEAKEISSVELTREFFAAIAEKNPDCRAYITINETEALAQAAAADEARAAGRAGALAGVPLGLKDILVTKGLRTTAASRILENFVPPYDGTVVSKLREAGAVFLGKTNMDEFAMGSSNENSAFGPVQNPAAPGRIPGGSSGGSAAAVAASLCAAALGTDTGGSIRQPAALTGTVGLKPTYGRVSRFGVIAFASSLDQVGPMAHNVWDAAKVLEVVSGHDPRDATSARQSVGQFSAAAATGPDALKGLRVGVPREYFVEGMQEEVEAAVRKTIDEMAAAGATIVDISLPHTQYAVATYYLIATAEASSNLARYDGIRYGRRAEGKSLEEIYHRSRGEGFGPEVKRRIMLGTYALSAGYYDAYYLRAQKVRTLIRRDFEEAFTRCDVIAGPTSPVTAERLGARIADPLQMYLMDVYTIPSNLAGLPCASIPCGFDSEGLPVGLQLIGQPMDEATMLRVAHAYERAHSWVDRRPELTALAAAGPPPGASRRARPGGDGGAG